MKWFFSFLTLILSFSPIITHAQEASDDIHYILVIDKTKSMIGKGDGNGNNIWGDVLNATDKFIDNLPDKGIVSVYTFADALSGENTYNLEETGSKGKIKEFLSSINLDGNFTAIYDAMDKVFKEFIRIDIKNPVLIYLFTDGKDNRSSMDFDSILKYYEANRTDYAHAYYIKLRGGLSKEIKDKINRTKGIDFVDVDNIDYSSAFPLTLHPRFNKLAYNLALSRTQTQVFDVTGDKPGQIFKFDAKLINVDPALGNISLSKSSGYVLKEVNNECDFEIKVYGDLKTEKGKVYLAKIKLSNPQDGVHKITFSPDEIDVEFSNANPPKVVVNQSWKRK